MATTSPDQQEQQQQQQQPVLYPQAASSSSSPSNGGAWKSSGSIGPFFAVMAVIIVLAVLSCLLSRVFVSRTTTPPSGFSFADCFGWLRRKCSRCASPHDVEIGSKASKKKETNNGESLKGTEETSCPPTSTSSILSGQA